MDGNFLPISVSVFAQFKKKQLTFVVYRDIIITCVSIEAEMFINVWKHLYWKIKLKDRTKS